MAKVKDTKQLISLPSPAIYWDVEFFEGELEDVIDRVSNLKSFIKERIEENESFYPDTKYPSVDEYDKVIIQFNNNYDGYVEIEIKPFRYETDEEFENRLKKSKEAARKRKETLAQKAIEKEKEERKLYEELKQKFG